MPLRRRGSQARGRPSRRIVLPGRLDPREQIFEQIVATALDALPPEIQRLLGKVAIVIDDEPDFDQIDESGSDGDTLYGVYEGVPATAWAADWAAVPNKITLFRVPLEQDFPDPVELADEVRRTVLHELGHHVGFDDARLVELDLD